MKKSWLEKRGTLGSIIDVYNQKIIEWLDYNPKVLTQPQITNIKHNDFTLKISILDMEMLNNSDHFNITYNDDQTINTVTMIPRVYQRIDILRDCINFLADYFNYEIDIEGLIEKSLIPRTIISVSGGVPQQLGDIFDKPISQIIYIDFKKKDMLNIKTYEIFNLIESNQSFEYQELENLINDSGMNSELSQHNISIEKSDKSYKVIINPKYKDIYWNDESSISIADFIEHLSLTINKKVFIIGIPQGSTYEVLTIVTLIPTWYDNLIKKLNNLQGFNSITISWY